MTPTCRLVAALFAGLLLTTAIRAQPPAKDAARFERWEKDIQAFEQRDKDKPAPKDAVLFAGSSSIRQWDVAKSFPDLEVVNRGFGGSQIADSTHFAARIILPHRPRAVVLYAGDNDLAAGKAPEQVLADFQAFVRAVHKELPKTKVLFLAVKPSPKREKLMDAQRKANGLIEAFCKQDERLLYVDVFTPMLDKDGKPRPELFVKDMLHLNEEGYRLWTALLKPHLK